MAAAEAGLGLEGLERFDTLSQEIEIQFSEFTNQLETRKVQLLYRVRRMKELYQKHRDIEKAIEQMEVIRKATSDVLTENLTAGSKEQVVSLWEDKIRDLRREKEKLDSVCELKFLPNSVEIYASINKIHLRECGVVEFNKRREPLLMAVKRGESEEELYLPFGIPVDTETDLVYLAGFCKRTISVYSLEGDFIKSFGKGKLISPSGICVSEEFVFVSDMLNSAVVKFLKSGEFVCDTESQNEENQLDLPHNLCVHSQSVYVCNYNNNRIELLNFNLLFIKSFGESKLTLPQDIKIHKDTIFVVTQSDKSVHTFNTQLEFISSIHLTGLNNRVSFFAIDLNGNFIISDSYAGCLKVFSPTGQYIDSLGDGYMTLPHGITIDRHNRIISLSVSLHHSFQIY